MKEHRLSELTKMWEDLQRAPNIRVQELRKLLEQVRNAGIYYVRAKQRRTLQNLARAVGDAIYARASDYPNACIKAPLSFQ